MKEDGLRFYNSQDCALSWCVTKPHTQKYNINRGVAGGNESTRACHWGAQQTFWCRCVRGTRGTPAHPSAARAHSVPMERVCRWKGCFFRPHTNNTWVHTNALGVADIALLPVLLYLPLQHG